MKESIFRNTIFVAAVVLLCSLSIIMGVLYDYFDDVQTAQLRDELRIAAVGTELQGEEFLRALDAEDYRITWIAADGTVIFDSDAEAADMENHADREEIREAMEKGVGSGVRQSQTQLERTAYEAVRLGDGSVLRISTGQQIMLILVVGMLHPVIVVLVIAIILSSILANRMSRKIVKPLNSLDLEHPLENDVYEEISPLLRRINQQHLQITSQLQTLRQKTDEFDQITKNMQEGLVLLDRDERILSINPTAKALFSAESDCIGKEFLDVDRSREMCLALTAAMKSGHGTARANRNGRDYRFDLSRIRSDGDVVGAVVLAFDETETLNAERNRREFSANVSHELKTPLQSIMGSAELLESGLVKQEDIPRFVGHIRKESSRLLNLIEDIIRLSQLDEGAPVPAEELDLLELAREAAATVQSAAEKKQVCVTVTGEKSCIQGVRRMVQELIYNLCDNAVKYNRTGGSVHVHIEDKVLTVSDTGIGIPAEHQSRVFERFYRVDKSHSRASGGTGLGLSIVKHAASYHNAHLELRSTVGEGTTITVRF